MSNNWNVDVEGWWILAMTINWNVVSIELSTDEMILTLLRLATSFTNEMTSKLAAESRPLVGSSKKRILGAVMS